MKILLLAGTAEANHLAGRLLEEGHAVIASLAGSTRIPKPLPCETRIGGFGGGRGFLAWIAEHGPELVIDATHPFAHRISARTSQLCREASIPYLQVLRPPWTLDGRKSQYEVRSVARAREFIPAGARVFLATGRQTLQDFGAFTDCYLICRQIEPPDGPFPFPNGEFLVGRPPFPVEDEVALFSGLRIDWLIVKNAGGTASYSKIEAAAELGIPVLMLKRPRQPVGPQVASVDEAMTWVKNFADC